jgi:hypothetical protein
MRFLIGGSETPDWRPLATLIGMHATLDAVPLARPHRQRGLDVRGGFGLAVSGMPDAPSTF